MAALGALSAVASLAGTAISAFGTIAAGKAEQQRLNYEAAEMETRGKEEAAAAQKEALELGRRKKLALSTLQARTAASGLGTTDPTVLDITGEIDQYGTYQQQLARYGGEARQRAFKSGAIGNRYAGKQARTASMFGAAGTILGGAANMFDRFAGPSYGTGGRYG